MEQAPHFGAIPSAGDVQKKKAQQEFQRKQELAAKIGALGEGVAGGGAAEPAALAVRARRAWVVGAAESRCIALGGGDRAAPLEVFGELRRN